MDTFCLVRLSCSPQSANEMSGTAQTSGMDRSNYLPGSHSLDQQARTARNLERSARPVSNIPTVAMQNLTQEQGTAQRNVSVARKPLLIPASTVNQVGGVKCWGTSMQRGKGREKSSCSGKATTRHCTTERQRLPGTQTVDTCLHRARWCEALRQSYATRAKTRE